jgi:hypothetical protein
MCNTVKLFGLLSCLVSIQLLGVLFCLAPSSDSHHVIFENIGQMAGALSYLHCKLTLNISSIFLQHQLYHTALTEYFKRIQDSKPDFNPTNWYYQERLLQWMVYSYHNHLTIVNIHINNSLEINEQLLSLRAILPQPSAGPNPRVLKREVKDKNRGPSRAAKRSPHFLGLLGIPLGIFGTFMGLYNKAQIEKLQMDFQDLKLRHNRLVEVVDQHEHHLQLINSTFNFLIHGLHLMATHNPALTSSRLLSIETQIKDRIQIAIHTIQQAQHRRLAIDFLTHQQLLQLYQQLQKQAESNGCILLTHQHSDLFQLEASYFFDGKDFHMLLHVPMVPKDSLLRLFRLHPFPLPLTKDHALIPVTDHNVLALSSGFRRYSAQLSHNDLMGCHVVNNIYLCERQGVLNENLNTTCLGALYQQNFEAVKKLCHLEIHKAGEMVHQLTGNWFLSYSPEAQTVPINCRNGTSAELYLAHGINKFFLSPGCNAHLIEHLVMSDISMKLDSDILHFEWRWNDVALRDLQADNILPQLKLMMDSGVFRPTYSDIQQLNVDIKRAPGWWAHLVSFTGLSVLFLLFFSTILFVCIRLCKIRDRISQIICHIPHFGWPHGPMPDQDAEEIELHSLQANKNESAEQ